MSATLRIVDCLWSRCDTLMETGQTGQAAVLLQRLLHLELPQTLRAEATLMLAELLRSNGEYQAARRHVSAALAGDADDPALHHFLGCLHEEDDLAGSERSALKHLRKAVRLAPDSSECHRALGVFLREQGKPDRGMTHLRKAVRLEPDNLDNLRSLIAALVESGQNDEAKQFVRLVQFRLGKNHPDVQALWNELTFALAHQKTTPGEKPSAAPILKIVAERKPFSQRHEPTPRILRFDDAHQRAPRRPRRVRERESQ
jgi:Tfp pilus assembly protein PilF